MAVLAPSRRAPHFPISMSRYILQIIGIVACRTGVIWARAVRYSGASASSARVRHYRTGDTSLNGAQLW
ncbi:hypothetical protein BGAL_0309g00030 [Botrytis galanthina]|uniref:Uncharacterized protein n=1 Tax=Botrytis galanthina TaxID=278940 RepID=A0A4S8R2X9_9HELO|nr:hypothetical protein BGAL_0309g00030 [Botrytis galanthina]